MIVVFSGMDCAGKSTQIDKLTCSLQKNGERVFYIWSRGGYTSGIEWLKRGIRFILGRKIPDAGRTKARTQKLSKPWIARLWLTVAMFDLMILYGIILRFRSLIGQVVICDRYLGDTALDFSINFPHMKFKNMLLWKFLVWFTPTPDKSFLLWIPVDESIKRGKMKNEPFPDDKETLEWRLKAYLNSDLFPDRLYLKLDCRQPIQDVSDAIINGL